MAIYSIYASQRLPVTPGQAWDFFCDPDNLPIITPPGLGFQIVSPPQTGPHRIYAGQIIEYRLLPLPFWKTYWMTEITHVQEGRYFVDEQRFGPYRLWHHQHHFIEIDGGVEMKDVVHYRIPFWWIGDLANHLFVRRQLNAIFEFRRQKTEELFGTY